MTDTGMLFAVLERNGKKAEDAAACLGISLAEFLEKAENKREFRASEMDRLCRLLKLEDWTEKAAIFFTMCVD